MTAKDPMSMIGDYPPEIRKKCEDLGLVEAGKKRFSKKEIIRKIIGMIVFGIIFALILSKVNKADTFWKGFIDSYIIWLAIDWFDALIIDCLWFCHSKKVIIKGTEGMKEYKDYLFHVKQSCIGMLLGLPVCLLVGLLVMIF